jgi:hypothetical protein
MEGRELLYRGRLCGSDPEISRGFLVQNLPILLQSEIEAFLSRSPKLSPSEKSHFQDRFSGALYATELRFQPNGSKQAAMAPTNRRTCFFQEPYGSCLGCRFRVQGPGVQGQAQGSGDPGRGVDGLRGTVNPSTRPQGST